jgi:hypothetical protein
MALSSKISILAVLSPLPGNAGRGASAKETELKKMKRAVAALIKENLFPIEETLTFNLIHPELHRFQETPFAVDSIDPPIAGPSLFNHFLTESSPAFLFHRQFIFAYLIVISIPDVLDGCFCASVGFEAGKAV